MIFAEQIDLKCSASLQDEIQEAITGNEKSDGFGAQFQQIIVAAIAAEILKKKFVYIPFQAMEHNYDNDPDFLAKKERLINFIGNFETIDEAIRKNYIVKRGCYVLWFDENVVAAANSSTLKKIKKIFRANKNTINYFNNQNLNIAIHIRRLNPHDCWTYGTDVPDSTYVSVIDKLRAKYKLQNPVFHVYSQGNLQNFSAFDSEDIILHLNQTVEDTFTAMVLADVLVTGKSSFSYTAGYLSDGVVYYNSYAHKPLPHWTSIEALLSDL